MLRRATSLATEGTRMTMSDPDWTAAEPHIQALRKLNFLPVSLHVCDVHELRGGLSDEQAMEILDRARDEYADFGIGIEDIELAIQDLAPDLGDDIEDEDEE
jgi:hypothetical protein